MTVSPALPAIREQARHRVLPLRRRSGVSLLLVSAVGAIAFGWPFFARPGAVLSQPAGAWLFVVLLPLLLVVVLSEVSEGGLDAKAVALLGVLTAVASVLRPLSGGVTGFQPMFVVIVIAGRVFGPGFGFTLGATSMLTSALVTGGVGPWLPFQMIAAAWVGWGAGVLPRATGRREVLLVAGYAGVASLLFGILMNLWFWPFLAPTGGLSFQAGASVATNAGHLLAFSLATSLGFDLPRAAGNLVLVLIVGALLLRALRRVARRAVFEPVPTTGCGR